MRHRIAAKKAAIERAQATANSHQQPVSVYREEDEGDVGFTAWPASWKREAGMRKVATVLPRYIYFSDIKKRNKAIGHRWFEPDTMRFFSSRVHESIYSAPDGRAYFVSSERPPSGRRAYSVRRAELDGSVSTVGEFCGYATGRAAHAAAARLAKEGGAQ